MHVGRQPSAIRTEGDSAFVSLSRGFEAAISIEDIPAVSGFRWCVLIGQHGHAYAYRSDRGAQILMHRALTGADKGEYVDHVDGDGLNNRRSNIRLCTQTQNMANKAVERRNKLTMKGASPSRGRFRATITPNGQKVHLGMFNTPEEAAAAYRGAAIVLWGDFAKN